MIAQAMVLLAVWIHLWVQHSSCRRYVFPVVLMGSGLAALGLLRVSALAAEIWRWAAAQGGQSHFRGDKVLIAGGVSDAAKIGTVPWQGLAVAAPAVVVGAIALAAAFCWNCGPRTAKVELGRWLRDRAGPAPVLFGPDGFTQVVNYYAGGRCASFAPTEREETVRTFFAQCRPNVVLLPRDEPPGNNEFVARISAAAGLRPLDCGRLPASCAGVAVWMRGQSAGGGKWGQAPSPETVLADKPLSRRRSQSPFSAAGPDLVGVDRARRLSGP